jgi:hypothetical protein
MRLTTLVVMAGFCVPLPSAHAQGVDADRFLSEYAALPPDGKRILGNHLSAIEEGFGWANAALNDRHEQKLFCQPGHLALTHDQLVDILRKEVEEVPPTGHMLVGLALLFALQRVFPCEAGPR